MIRFNRKQFNKDMKGIAEFLKYGLLELSRLVGIYFIFPLIVGWLAIFLSFGVNILTQWVLENLIVASFLTWMIGWGIVAILYTIFKACQWFWRRWFIVNGGRK